MALTPNNIDSLVYLQTSLSARRSYNRQDASSDTNEFGFGPGAKSKDMTSALCPWKDCKTCPDSTSHRAHVASPDPVKTWLSDPGNRQQDMYEVCVPTVFFREDKSSSMVRGYT